MSNNYLLMAKFNSPKEIINVAKEIKKTNIEKFETYTPFPIHGMDSAMGLKDSKLAWLSLIGGLTGLTIGTTLQIWTSAVDYPIVVSGKEFISLPAFLPVSFELTILLTAFATVFGMFAINKLPQLYSTEFNHSSFNEVTDDKFFVSIDSTDKNFDKDLLIKIINDNNGEEIEEVYDTK